MCVRRSGSKIIFIWKNHLLAMANNTENLTFKQYLINTNANRLKKQVSSSKTLHISDPNMSGSHLNLHLHLVKLV